MSSKKSRIITTPMSDEEYEMAKELAKKERASLASLVRLLIAKESIREGYREEDDRSKTGR